ncbi:MAG: spore cortex biosynthesis protein YabQ [Firmicutes bacterium]|nr:spore cortex biosynthesis protein YabQ [Bacillota bacterium]
MLELQLTVIGLTFLCGVALGLVFDIWRACRTLGHFQCLVTSLGDLLFWFIAAVIVATVLLSINYGEVRGWFLLSAALGFALYQEFVSPHVQQPMRRFLRFILAGFRHVAIWLGLPVWLPVRFVIRQGAAGSKKGKKIGRALKRLIKRKLEFWHKKNRP